jgi:hypothetical protein
VPSQAYVLRLKLPTSSALFVHILVISIQVRGEKVKRLSASPIIAMMSDHIITSQNVPVALFPGKTMSVNKSTPVTQKNVPVLSWTTGLFVTLYFPPVNHAIMLMHGRICPFDVALIGQ